MFVFVYGTLKQGYGNNRLLSSSELLGEATLEGFSIYDLGPFPAIVADEGEEVVGELYSINEQTLERLDMLEGFVEGRPNNLYERISVTVEHDGKEFNALTYTMPTLNTNNHTKVNKVWNK